MTLSPITQRKIRIAVVGCGRIAKNHFQAIAAYAEALELCALCDNGCSRATVEKDEVVASAAGIALDWPALFSTGGRS